MVDALNEGFADLQDLPRRAAPNVEEPETDTETTPEQHHARGDAPTETAPPEQTETLPAPEQPHGGPTAGTAPATAGAEPDGTRRRRRARGARGDG